MKKLLKKLTVSRKDLMGKRGEALVNILEMGHTQVVSALKMDIMNLEQKIEDHQDFSPTQTTQLKFEKPEDAHKWALELQEMKVKVSILKAELKIAEETTSDCFIEEDKKSK